MDNVTRYEKIRFLYQQQIADRNLWSSEMENSIFELLEALSIALGTKVEHYCALYLQDSELPIDQEVIEAHYFSGKLPITMNIELPFGPTSAYELNFALVFKEKQMRVYDCAPLYAGETYTDVKALAHLIVDQIEQQASYRLVD